MSKVSESVDPLSIPIRKCQASRLLAERGAIDKTQAEIARIIMVGKTTICDWESGRSSPPADMLARLECTGMDILYILTGSRAPHVSAARAQIDTARRTAADAIRYIRMSGLPWTRDSLQSFANLIAALDAAAKALGADEHE